jgi:Ner family transcriptional regulator
MAALRKTKKRWTLRGLSLASGYSAKAVGFALVRAWPAVEVIIARELQLHPKEIWPSRYNDDGTPRRRTAHAIRNRGRNVSTRKVA